MTSEKTKWHSLPWILVIGGAILSPVVTDLYNRVPIYTSFVWIWNVLLTTMNVQIKLWWILLMMVFLAVIYFVVKTKIKGRPEKAMLKYDADKFGHFIWKWDWIHNDILKRFEVKNARPLCTQTDCNHKSLIDIGFDDEWNVYVYECPNCKFQYSISEQPYEIRKFVETKYVNLQSQHHPPQS